MPAIAPLLSRAPEDVGGASVGGRGEGGVVGPAVGVLLLENVVVVDGGAEVGGREEVPDLVVGRVDGLVVEVVLLALLVLVVLVVVKSPRSSENWRSSSLGVAPAVTAVPHLATASSCFRCRVSIINAHALLPTCGAYGNGMGCAGERRFCRHNGNQQWYELHPGIAWAGLRHDTPNDRAMRTSCLGGFPI